MPLMTWLSEHVSATINGFHAHDDGVTAYQRSRGQPFNAYALEVCERVFYAVLKKARTKHDKRWNDGVYLGSSRSSNEHFVGRSSGHVGKARGLAR